MHLFPLFLFPLGITAVPREIEKQCLCENFGGGGANKVGDVQVANKDRHRAFSQVRNLSFLPSCSLRENS